MTSQDAPSDGSDTNAADAKPSPRRNERRTTTKQSLPQKDTPPKKKTQKAPGNKGKRPRKDTPTKKKTKKPPGGKGKKPKSKTKQLPSEDESSDSGHSEQTSKNRRNTSPSSSSDDDDDAAGSEQGKEDDAQSNTKKRKRRKRMTKHKNRPAQTVASLPKPLPKNELTTSEVGFLGRLTQLTREWMNEITPGNCNLYCAFEHTHDIQLLIAILYQPCSYLHIISPPPAAETKRIPFFYNWDRNENPRHIGKRLLDRYLDLKEDNAKYAKQDDRKAADYIELFSRQVSPLQLQFILYF